jgi:uncharacterized protein YbjT (DUF2867 family)
MTILVTGATGAVGRFLTAELLEADQSVRIVTRDANAKIAEGAEVVIGDFVKAGLPSSAFAGVDKAFVFPAQGGVDAFVQQAKAHGVKHFVVLSSLAAALEHARDQGSASAMHHLAIERSVQSTGVPATILRPGTFALNLLPWAQPLKYGNRVSGPYARSAQAPIHEADVAAVAAKVLTEAGHENRIYAMTGPEALTRFQQLEAIGAALGRELEFVDTTPDAFRGEMSKYIPEPIIKMLLDYWSDTVDKPDVVRPTVEQVTGHKARTLAQWAIDHVGDFR